MRGDFISYGGQRMTTSQILFQKNVNSTKEVSGFSFVCTFTTSVAISVHSIVLDFMLFFTVLQLFLYLSKNRYSPLEAPFDFPYSIERIKYNFICTDRETYFFIFLRKFQPFFFLILGISKYFIKKIIKLPINNCYSLI